MGRLLSSPPSLYVTVGLLAIAATPGATQAQRVTVAGVVVERTQSSRIGGATVRISGFPSYFTDLDGAFRFSRVMPGRHTLTVEAMGYRSRSLEVIIRADTSLVIELEPDPIRLDSLLVQGGTIRISGNVFDAATGRRVLYAQVTVSPGFPTIGAISGRFTVRQVPRGRAVAVVVEAVEYLPARIALITEADTTLDVELEPDSVGIRMLAEQVQKLETRSNAVPLPKRVFDRDDMARAPGLTVYDMIRVRLFGRDPFTRCLFIDEVQQVHPSILMVLTPGEVERVEIFGRGAMIRVYTKRFMVDMSGRRRDLGPIVYQNMGPLGPLCR